MNSRKRETTRERVRESQRGRGTSDLELMRETVRES